MTQTRYRDVGHSVKAIKDAVEGPRGILSPKVRLFTEGLIRQVNPKDYLSEILAIRYGVLRLVPYINDPVHVEWIRDPEALIEEIEKHGVVRADCDEITGLISACSFAIGREVDLITAGFLPPPAPHSHVFPRVHLPGNPTGAPWPVVVDPVAGTREPSMLQRIRSYTVYSLG